LYCYNNNNLTFPKTFLSPTFPSSSKLSLTLCLVQEKVEGKIVNGGKVGGRSIFPPFGISKKVDGKKVQDGSHLKKLSSQKWTESG
jgi:hypothetical protein